MIGVAMGINNLLEIFNEKYYENLEGGILESFGRLFRNAVKLYIYPMRKEAYEKYIARRRAAPARRSNAFASNVLINAKNVKIVDHLSNLYAHLLENHYIDSIVGFDNACWIFSRGTSCGTSRRRTRSGRRWSRSRGGGDQAPGTIRPRQSLAALGLNQMPLGLPASARRPSAACQTSKIGTPKAMSRARFSSETASPNSAPTPNNGASTA